MTLEELARTAPFARPPAVPAWSLGCFHRRSITYATGAEDMATRVIWVQSHGLTGDLRLPAARPDVGHRRGLADCTADELAALAQGEGGVADTGLCDGRMTWSNWAAFQPYDKWPEPGELRRVGPALIEFAPSGIYVEDWRLQPGSAGLRVGLRLVSETPPGGPEAPRDGGLVIAGEHAIFALARRAALPAQAPVHRQLAVDPSLAAAAFDARALYARRGVGGGWRVALSVDPFAEGAFLDLGGFRASGPGELLQSLEDGTARRWRIDTLLADQPAEPATGADEVALAWLAGEGDTLPPAR
ncbi:hypothetical protein [Phenylobacterium sp.]|jgi:hypothetical protein|uniref:hypothetical protein n=1 Tax=Phenylobacterium sp. TaxID=1871053 RepID=UPI002F3EC02B